MVISTHLPPPVMIDSTAVLDTVTHMLCCSWGMCFSAAPSSENDHGSMNLASKTAPVPSTIPSRVAAIHRFTGWNTWRCTSVTTWPVLRSYQCRLRCSVTLDNKVDGKVLRLDFASFFLPEPHEGRLIV